MSGSQQGDFIDSNVLVYAHSRQSGHQREKAAELLDSLWDAGTGRLSIQVLQEFFVVSTTKVSQPISIAEAIEVIEIYSGWTVHSPEPSDLLSAIDIQNQFRISFWDAMVINSAKRLGCRTLWTEDLNHGQTYAGVLVRNPFREMVMEEASPYGSRP